MNIDIDDAYIISFLINQLNKYRFNVNVNDIIEQSNYINKFISISDFNDIIGIDNTKDILNLSHHFIKISAYLFVINKIDKDEYETIIWNNQKILVENFYIKNIETDNYKALLTLLIYHHIINILENNQLYNNEYTTNLLKLNEVLVY